MKKSPFLLFIALSLSFIWQYSYAQKKSNNKYKTLTYADYAFKHKNYYSAIDYYLIAQSDDSVNAFITNRLAESYRTVRDYKNAVKWYTKTYQLNAHEYPLSLLKESEMLKMSGDYSSAEKNFNLFYKTYNDSLSDYYKGIAKKEMADCKWAMLANEDTSFEIFALGEQVNTANSDFAPVIINEDEMIYSSYPSAEIETIIPSSKDDHPYINLFRAKKNSAGFYEREKIEISIPDKKTATHIGNGAFSKNGKRFYFTSCAEDNTGKMICEIYVSIYDQKHFGPAKKIGAEINKDGYTSSHPNIGSIKKDEVLFFTSDRPGGSGGKDIWFSIIRNDSLYTTPINAGTKINSRFDEITPYYNDSSQCLYFSSNGWRNFGGFDIMRSEGTIKKWSSPENIGLPYNSSADDFYFVSDRDSSGYLVSNRAKNTISDTLTCCDDIFRFQTKHHKVFNKLLVLTGLVYDSNDVKHIPLNNSWVQLFDTNHINLHSDTSQQNKPYSFIIDRVLTNYHLTASVPDFEDGMADLEIISFPENDTIVQDIYVQRKKVKQVYTDEPVPVPAEIKLNKIYTLKNILYDFDMATLRPVSKKDIELLLILLNELPNIRIEISSHTDSKGSDAYNERLSQSRAESVVNELIKNGVDPSRLEARGYGEKIPIAPNTKPNGDDNPEGRQLNRRTDFRIIGDIKDATILYQR